MPEKTSKSGRTYEIDGKKLRWFPEDDNGETGNIDPVEIPLRIKLKLLRELSEENLDAAHMFKMIEAIVPGQVDVMDEMDVNDFQDMFQTWQSEYNTLAGGANLPESSGSSS